MNDILNLNETADYLRVSKQTIYNMIKDGRIKAYKVGREWKILRSDIVAYSESVSSNRILDMATKMLIRIKRSDIYGVFNKGRMCPSA